MRIDKIRKKNKTNIINLDLERLNVKYNNENSPIGDNSWQFRLETGVANINIDKILPSNHFNHYLPILKDIRFYISNQVNFSSHRTLLRVIDSFKCFFSFLEYKKITINIIENIDYNILLHFSDYLKIQKGAQKKWNTFLHSLKNMAEYKEISINNDIKKRNFPNIRFPDNSLKRNTYYTKKDFDGISKTIVLILNEYFSTNKFTEGQFVKSSFWFFALCTGLNTTALVNLRFRDFELLKEEENSKTYIITGIKNRSKKGIQQQTITIKNTENHLLEKVLKELKLINQNLKKIGLKEDYLFCYHTKNKKLNDNFVKYQGDGQKLHKSTFYKEKAKLFNVENVKLSTLNIRNHWSIELLNKTNSETIVSQMLGHTNLKTTKEHYMKSALTKESEMRFNIFQELIYLFSKDENTKDWVEFQKRLDIKEDSISSLISKIKGGFYDTSVGKCIKSEDKNCQSYLKCFNCENFSIVGEKDLWKTMSFRAALIEVKSNEDIYKKIYLPIVEKIDEILNTFDKKEIIKARNLLKKSKHPFWNNNIIIKTITDNFEKEIE